jgi:hypothetical protein
MFHGPPPIEGHVEFVDHRAMELLQLSKAGEKQGRKLTQLAHICLIAALCHQPYALTPLRPYLLMSTVNSCKNAPVTQYTKTPFIHLLSSFLPKLLFYPCVLSFAL